MFLQPIVDQNNLNKKWITEGTYKFHLCDTMAQVRQLVDVCIARKLCSFDLETSGLDNRVYPDEFFEDGKVTKYGIRTVDKIVGVCISFDGVNGYYLPLSHEAEGSKNLPWRECWDEMERLQRGCKLIFHGGIFDTEFLYPVLGKSFWKKEEFEDTFFLQKTINPLKSTPAGLKPLTKFHFNIEMIELSDLFSPALLEFLKKGKQGLNFSKISPQEGYIYGASDGIFTYKLYHVLREKLVGQDEFIYALEKNYMNVLRKLERTRIPIDRKTLFEIYEECKAKLFEVGDVVRSVIEAKSGKTGKWDTLNIGSPKQLSQALITDPEGLRLKPTAKMLGEGEEEEWKVKDELEDEESEESDAVEEKQYSLADDVIKELNIMYGAQFMTEFHGKKISIFDLITEFRHYDKMKGTYIEPLTKSIDKYGMVRPAFNQVGADTTRLTCKSGKVKDGYAGVPWQGIPRDSDDDKPMLFKRIRELVRAPEGYVVVKFDYAGEELRVITNLSGDPIWTESFLHKDGDVHSITARSLFAKSEVTKDERNRGKRSNFAVIYGGGAGAIQRNIGGTIEAATKAIDNMRHDVPVLMGYVESQKFFARKHKAIYTAFGRKIPIPTIDSKVQSIRRKAERCAINYTIQATSADVLKIAMVLVDKYLRENNLEDDVKYFLTVHDEIVFLIKPHRLMEVIPKIDYWMTYPWKMKKAHGKEWVVPLLTEPGIDIDWRARYDWFKMTDGSPATGEVVDGVYKGKLKKGEVYENGRIYQEVPDFLQGSIHRSKLDENGKPLPYDATSPMPPVIPPPPPPEPEVSTQNPTSAGAKPDPDEIDIENVSLPENPVPSVEVKETAPSPKEEPRASTPTPVPPAPVEPQEEAEKPTEPEIVLRFALTSTPTLNNVRKLQACAILAEGDQLLRVVSPRGDVILDESEGTRVKKDAFMFLASLFGL